jgi:hypothetical protein
LDDFESLEQLQEEKPLESAEIYKVFFYAYDSLNDNLESEFYILERLLEMLLGGKLFDLRA